jgi:hypothetical protein
MKKFGIAAVLFSMLLGVSASGCGNACDDLKAKYDECCAKFSDATAKSICEAAAKGVENASSDACDAALKSFTCTAQ